MKELSAAPADLPCGAEPSPIVDDLAAILGLALRRGREKKEALIAAAFHLLPTLASRSKR